jgi:hypothetical protein
LSIDLPGNHLLEPSRIELKYGWTYTAKLFHTIEGQEVLIGKEWISVGFGDSSHSETNHDVRRLLDLAYDFVLAKILLAEKLKKEADELTVRRRTDAIVNMIDHADALPKPAPQGGGSLTAF